MDHAIAAGGGTDSSAPIQVKEDGLLIEDVPATKLADRYGTPLHVLSETQLRDNYRRVRDAFTAVWEPGVRVHYSIKANPVLAVRRIFTMEGAGGDCMGRNELLAALRTGIDGSLLNLNGNSKGEGAIELAVEVGAQINLDDAGEIDRVERSARRLRRQARVALRIKPDLREFGDRESELRPVAIRRYGLENKWGLSLQDAIAVVRRGGASEHLELTGVHYHLGRQIGSPELFEGLLPSVVRFLHALREQTGWAPAILNLGGGLTQGRDPFGRRRRSGGAPVRADEDVAPPVEDYARRIARVLRRELGDHDLPLPRLELESGRFLTANAGVTLARVGTVKRIDDRTWVNVDVGTNNIGMMRAPDDAHAVVVADAPGPPGRPVDVVGPLCISDVLASDVPLPALAEGRLLAIMDTGAYADSESTTSNLIPRPSVVLVHRGDDCVIRERETFEALLARDRIPPHLA